MDQKNILKVSIPLTLSKDHPLILGLFSQVSSLCKFLLAEIFFEVDR